MQTRLELRGNNVIVTPGSDADHILVRSLLVRKWHSPNWIVPFESCFELLSILDGRAEADDQLLQRLDDFKGLKNNPYPLDEELIKTKMLGHQRTWLEWAMYFRAPGNLSEQGTGKSKMALDYVTLKLCNMVLIICKNSNCYKWAQEVKKHSDYKPFVLKGIRSERETALRKAKSYHDHQRPVCCIINYDYISRFMGPLCKTVWDAVVCDESTAIKSTRTKRHKAIVKLGGQVRYRLILTGTPILNSPEDAYGQFRFLNPNIFGKNHQGFKNRYITFGGWSGYQVTGYRNIEELSDKIERHSYRVLKTDCLDLPPKTFSPLLIEPTGEFKEGYEELVKATLLEIEEGRLIDNTLAIVKMARCLQYCAGFLYIDDKRNYRSFATPKMDELVDFMEDHFKSSKKLLIWAYHKATLILLHQQLKLKFPELQIDVGSSELSAFNRQELIDTFNDPHTNDTRARCLILQTTAYMHGIDVRCDTSYYYQRSFSLEEWLQSQDRVHGINRGGGTFCNYVTSVIDGTVEKTVDEALKRKKSLSDLILKDNVDLETLMRGQL